MVKPIKQYALVGGWSSQGHGFRVIGITREKGGQVYARDMITEAATHRAARDVLYRYPPGTELSFAMDAGMRADAEDAKHRDGIAAAHRRVRELERNRNMAVLDAAKGLWLHPVSPAPSPPQEYTGDRLASDHEAPATGETCTICKPEWGHNAAPGLTPAKSARESVHLVDEMNFLDPTAVRVDRPAEPKREITLPSYCDNGSGCACDRDGVNPAKIACVWYAQAADPRDPPGGPA